MIKNTADLGALIVLVGCLSLLAFGIDSEVKAILATATGWLFGSKYIAGRVRR